METVDIKITELKPYKNNAKKHPAEQVRSVAESIKQFGWAQPIVIDENNEIIIGHGRLKAAKLLKLKTAPCYVLKGLTEEQKRKLRLLDNKTNESEWDIDILKDEIADLDFSDFPDIDFGIFDEEEKTAIVEDEAPEVDEDAEPITKLGDVWQLGAHRLMCGDSTKPEIVNILMGGAKAEIAFTDPPWNVDYGGSSHPSWKQRSIMNDHMSTEEFKGFMSKAFNCLNLSLQDGGMVYVVMSAQEWGNAMLTLAENNFHWSSTIIWKKDSLVLSRKDYHTQYEPIWYGWKEGSRLHPLKDRKQSDVWDIPRPKRSDEHPTMKPVELVARAIRNSSNEKANCLDLFGGSGTTLIACEQTNRRCFMMELDPKYCDVIIKRWEALTGKTAEKIK